MIILLSGSINAGKTTVSKQLTQMLPRTAHVEVDDLHEFIAWMPLEESIPLNLQNAAAVTHTFAGYGLNVVISYPLRPEDYAYLLRELQPLDQPIFCLTLSPKLDTVLKNRGERELTEWELQRIPYHYQTGINNPSFGLVIDNTHQTPEETAREILAYVQGEGG